MIERRSCWFSLLGPTERLLKEHSGEQKGPYLALNEAGKRGEISDSRKVILFVHTHTYFYSFTRPRFWARAGVFLKLMQRIHLEK